MPGLVPGIHVLLAAAKAWMAGTSPALTKERACARTRRLRVPQGKRGVVVGCGPVGAAMTLALVRKGIPVTLIELLPDAAEDQRAATVHPPTVEMLVELGLEKEAFAQEPSGGMSAPLFQFRDRRTGELYAV